VMFSRRRLMSRIEIAAMKMPIIKALFGLSLFCAAVYLLIYSNFLSFLEGDNPDGSSSLTWRSGVAATVLFLICQLIAWWAVHRRVASAVLVGIAICIFFWLWLSGSRFGFIWEPHYSDGTFPLTWRSDLVLLGSLTGSLGLGFLVRLAIKLAGRR
jgi:H+/Cl- antiporter ClcA